MLQDNEDFEIPDFLRDSPFVPVSTATQYDEIHRRRSLPDPTLTEILKSKRVRRVATSILAILAVLMIKWTISSILGYFDGPRCLHSKPIKPPTGYLPEDIDWSKYAYVQYATNSEYLCNSAMIFDSLKELESKADRLLLYSSRFDEESDTTEGRLLRKARDKYEAKVIPVEVQHNDQAYWRWADSYTKLLAFNQTQYKRILHLDSDSIILSKMDELFFIPSTPVALPRAYWLDQPTLASHIMVITPSSTTFSTIQHAIANDAQWGIYDMEIVNSLFGSNCRILPHQRYSLLTGELRRTERQGHRNYLSDRGDGKSKGKGKWKDGWNPEAAVEEASWVHFSDDPLPKPWEAVDEGRWERMKPKCKGKKGKEDCTERNLWVGFYEEFWDRRERVCNVG